MSYKNYILWSRKCSHYNFILEKIDFSVVKQYVWVPGMVFDGMATKIRHALPHSDMYQIKQEQDSVKTEEPPLVPGLWTEARGSPVV